MLEKTAENHQLTTENRQLMPKGCELFFLLGTNWHQLTTHN